LGKAAEISELSPTFMFGKKLQVQDLLPAGGQAAQQMRLAATRCSAHHHQLQLVYKAAVFTKKCSSPGTWWTEKSIKYSTWTTNFQNY
jgi:hypothetical protein